MTRYESRYSILFKEEPEILTVQSNI